MFLLRKPSENLVRQFISHQREQPFSYPEVGATRTTPPAGYTVDHNRIKLGDGENTYRRAVAALQNWQHFDLGWVRNVSPETAIEVGGIAAVQAKAMGLWSLNACRIIYVINEARGRKAVFGFAYGTLGDHVERGEERFTVEWHEDNSVWYDLYAFSRPQHRLAKLGSPLCRMLQKRFARESLAAMVDFSR